MRIFATADLHGDRRKMHLLSDASETVDMVLVCGDIGGYSGTWPHGISQAQEEDVKYLDGILSSLPCPGYYILGNDDWTEYTGPGRLLSPVVQDSYQFVPFEFVSTTPFQTNREVNDHRIFYELTRLTAGPDTVMVAHTPPYRAGDRVRNGERVGSYSLHRWLLESKPALWLCGHVHEDPCTVLVGSTLVCNCSTGASPSNELRGYIIELLPKGGPIVEPVQYRTN